MEQEKTMIIGEDTELDDYTSIERLEKFCELTKRLAELKNYPIKKFEVMVPKDTPILVYRELSKGWSKGMRTFPMEDLPGIIKKLQDDIRYYENKK